MVSRTRALISLLAVACSAVGLAACGGDSSSDPSTSASGGKHGSYRADY